MQTRNFSIRAATPLDEDAVGSVLRASYPPLMAAAYDPQTLAQLLPFMTQANPRLLSSGTYYVAQAGDEVVGCGGWTREYPDLDIVAGVAHLRHFGTHECWTRRGVGRAIYDVCETTARAACIDTFMCNASLKGVAFYMSLGFDVVREVAVPMPSGLAMRGMEMRRALG